jgi:hypothetical protein
MFVSDWRVLMTPQNATLDSLNTFLIRILSNLSSQFQFSLSAVTLGGIYLSV